MQRTMDPTTPQRYGAGARAFHWVTALLVLAAFILGEGGPEARIYAPERASQLATHETLGLAVFVLTLLRLAWRAVDRSPAPVPMAPWMLLASKLVHWALFGLLVLVPATAIAGAWLEGHPVTVLALGTLGPWLPLSHDAGSIITELHTLLGDAIMWLAGLHAAAALYHHLVLRDRVLAAMMPGR
jgi:cytochrome b561